jgi:hypothetical protein
LRTLVSILARNVELVKARQPGDRAIAFEMCPVKPVILSDRREQRILFESTREFQNLNCPSRTGSHARSAATWEPGLLDKNL